MTKKKKFLWLDLEMTGLDEKQHHIVEVAAIVTDVDFQKLGEYHAVVYQPPEVLAKMDDWCQNTHKESGLLEKIPHGKKLSEVEKEFDEFLDRFFKKKEKIILAGNSIWNDRRFLEAYLPSITKRLHYRMIDVSSWKEIFRRKWKISFKKKNTHRALDDILESIEELKHYLSYVHVPSKKKRKDHTSPSSQKP